jgi:hypothetical protein
MTRKHFKQIADAMQNLRKFEAHDSEMSETVAHCVRFSSVVDALANVLADSNPRFDRERFLTACGIGADKPKRKAAERAVQKSLHVNRITDVLNAAREAIERKDAVCFVVAAEHGQIFANVKHMTWFAEAVAEAL